MAPLRRTLSQYAGCTPNGVASGSKAQMMYFVEDAKADIAALAQSNGELLSVLRECQSALATMISPVAIQQTSVLNAFAMVTAAEVKARAAIAQAEGLRP